MSSVRLDARRPSVAALRSDRRNRRVRTGLVTASLGLVVVALCVLTLCFGSVRLSLGQVLGSLLRTGDNAAVDFIVRDLYWPQVVAALGVGLALGAAGTIFQQLLRNPLASPDFVGISSGASVTAVAGLAMPALVGVSTPLLAVVGAVTTSVLMYLLAWRDGISGYRFILIGIGVAACCEGVVGYLLTRTSLDEAQEAMHWLVGSIGQSGSGTTYALWVAVAVLLPGSVALHRMLRSLGTGDDLARSHGVRVEAVRFTLILVGVVLTGLATAAAGPLIFVALVAGPVADRLLGRAAGAVLPAALVGAALTLTADYTSLYLLPVEVPTGVVTGAVGAPYLLWVLATTNTRGAGG